MKLAAVEAPDRAVAATACHSASMTSGMVVVRIQTRNSAR